ncbi:NAD-dependent DNA ligase LigA [Segatella copri]|uniref:DNA ligase n=2 Tax=Segatella copri TaxID=165179 RepID=A0A3E5E762_9BACT|nr:NAD-dependent DNA ligase LigA [Segatella copri]RGS14886.1 NAD-dependent DNA ligase LigA [Segatella copri]RGW79385.1 NAD-dependent DNA ligase LigA [Segatella copri]
MMEEKLLQMKSLVERLNQASDSYYNGKGELMTDYEWDALFDQLKRLEEETGEILPDSPTNRVSEDSIVGKKEEHEFAALSLAKTKQVSDLVKWAEDRPIWISWKLDGLTLVVTYDGGKLTKIVTRGNGHIGTNITHLAPAISGIPGTISEKGHLVVRGEAVISYTDFEQFIIESEGDYANPRNLASGSLTLKDIEEVKQRHIQWIPFTLVYTERELTSWGERMQMLKDLGMNPVERERIDHPTTENIQLEIDKFTEKVTSKKNPFPVDGLVICYDDTAYAATGSVTGHHATRAGFAFKWQDEHADTVLDHIEWSCAASTITPVAVFKPVELEGTTVQRASLCNVSECERLGIGDKGTRLQVIKANKIIPKVINITEVVGSFVIPNECPVCHAPAVVRESESGTKTLHCTNAACPAKQLKKFARFVSKEGINIDGISEQTVWKFINHGFIREYADFYKLKNYAFEISCFEGFGKKSVSNLLESVEKSRHTDGRHLLYALNIPLCGGDVAKKLLSRYKVKELIETARLSMFDDEFASIDGIGPEKSAKFIAWFKDDVHFQHVQHLLSELIIEEQEPVETGNKCQGLTFVVTGDVHHYKNRNELKAYIESQGGKVTGSVSKSTNFLINNDAASQSSKNKKAHELNIPIITEDEFIEKFQE